MPKKVFAAVLENLEPMLDFITQEAKRLNFDGKKLSQIRLASEEALVNVINYAYPDKGGNIEITCDIEDNQRLVVVIIDWGISFNPLNMPEPDIKSPVEKRQIGGLGIYLVRSIMDEVNYRREGNQNILTFVKNCFPS
jgi:serine/threonine-protein kinase RsbW